MTLARRLAPLLLLVGCAVQSAEPADPESVPMATLGDYVQLCGICHLAEGQGVPGAFPPLDGRLAAWAGTEDGRAYLVGVLANGLFGPIQVGSDQFAGAMPGMANQLSSAQMAGMLNFILTRHAEAGPAVLYSAGEVERIREAIGTTPSHAMRPGG